VLFFSSSRAEQRSLVLWTNSQFLIAFRSLAELLKHAPTAELRPSAFVFRRDDPAFLSHSLVSERLKMALRLIYDIGSSLSSHIGADLRRAGQHLLGEVRMVVFVRDHWPQIIIGWGTLAGLAWLFIYGACKASEDNCESFKPDA
jgi:hypothetical protein